MSLAALFVPRPTRLTFSVYGVPIPKGSSKGFIIRPKGGGPPRAVVTHDNPRTRPWQESVVSAAQGAMVDPTDVDRQLPPLEGPVALTLRFYLPRPKGAPRRVVDHLKKPDLDKLVRCVKDGLTRAGVYRDDSQVVAMVANKAYAGGVFDQAGPAGVPRCQVIVGACELPELARP